MAFGATVLQMIGSLYGKQPSAHAVNEMLAQEEQQQPTAVRLLASMIVVLCVIAGGTEASSRSQHRLSTWGEIYQMYKYRQQKQPALGLFEPSVNILSPHTMFLPLSDSTLGGQSELTSLRSVRLRKGLLNFEGTINTRVNKNGAGFMAIRTTIPEGVLTTASRGVKLRLRGDGKTYKLFLHKGESFWLGQAPKWEFDLPTIQRSGRNGVKNDDDDDDDDGVWQEILVPFDELLQSWGGGPDFQPSMTEKERHVFHPNEMREIGVMLSFKLADGRRNPKETFGEGEIHFSLLIQSIETY